MTASTAAQQTSQQAGTPAQREKSGIRFEVTTGAHRGAVLMLDGTDYRIGSSPEADIVLSDPGVAPEHAVLHIERGMMRIDATGAEVKVGPDALPLSCGCRVRLPVNVTLGAAQVHLSDPDHSDPRRGLLREPLVAAGVLACVVVAIAVVAQELPRTGNILAGAADAGTSEYSTSGFPAEDSSAQSAVTAEDAVRELSERLDAAMIRTLRIKAENGRLVATGTLTKQETAAWSAIQQWFDQTYGGRIVLTSRIDPPGTAMPALQLQAIWYGERPYILTADGERYFKGAVLNNGWILRDIAEDRLLLEKDGSTAALTYR